METVWARSVETEMFSLLPVGVDVGIKIVRGHKYGGRRLMVVPV